MVTSLGVLEGVRWSEEEKGKDVAVVEVKRSAWASYHVARVRTAERPHVHDRHDLTVVMLKGKARVHLGEEIHEVGVGDVVHIPHGSRHWVENVGEGASEAYVVFTPAFNGEDRRFVE